LYDDDHSIIVSGKIVDRSGLTQAYFGVTCKKLSKKTERIHDNRDTGRESNLEPSEYKAGVTNAPREFDVNYIKICKVCSARPQKPFTYNTLSLSTGIQSSKWPERNSEHVQVCDACTPPTETAYTLCLLLTS
jgi:hypothetical protein